MIKCRKCGFDNEDFATYCLSCFETITEEDRLQSQNTDNFPEHQEEDVKSNNINNSEDVNSNNNPNNYEEKVCKICSKPIESGEPLIQCDKCYNFYHRNCYESNGGCIQPRCAEDMKTCRYCGKLIKRADSTCRFCGEYVGGSVGSDNVGRPVSRPQAGYASKGTCSDATYALVFGIISLFCCGVVFGPLAIYKANSAIKTIDDDPSYQGRDMAQVGKVLGIIGLVLVGLKFVFGLLGGLANIFVLSGISGYK